VAGNASTRAISAGSANGLDEDVLGEGVDRAEHLARLAGAQEVDGQAVSVSQMALRR
jgi:hypothetical protein